MNRSSTSSSALVVLPIAETITSSRAGSAATIRARFSTPSAERTEAPPNLYILMGGMSFVFSFPCGALAAGPLPVSEGSRIFRFARFCRPAEVYKADCPAQGEGMSDGCRRLCPTPAGSGSRGKSIASENFWQKISVKAMRIWTGAASSPGNVVVRNDGYPEFRTKQCRSSFRSSAGQDSGPMPELAAWPSFFIYSTSVPVFHSMNDSTSVISSIRFDVGLPAPWPAFVSMRISTGLSQP